jgi:hypothetical protein
VDEVLLDLLDHQPGLPARQLLAAVVPMAALSGRSHAIGAGGPAGAGPTQTVSGAIARFFILLPVMERSDTTDPAFHARIMHQHAQAPPSASPGTLAPSTAAFAWALPISCAVVHSNDPVPSSGKSDPHCPQPSPMTAQQLVESLGKPVRGESLQHAPSNLESPPDAAVTLIMSRPGGAIRPHPHAPSMVATFAGDNVKTLPPPLPLPHEADVANAGVHPTAIVTILASSAQAACSKEAPTAIQSQLDGGCRLPTPAPPLTAAVPGHGMDVDGSCGEAVPQRRVPACATAGKDGKTTQLSFLQGRPSLGAAAGNSNDATGLPTASFSMEAEALPAPAAATASPTPTAAATATSSAAAAKVGRTVLVVGLSLLGSWPTCIPGVGCGAYGEPDAYPTWHVVCWAHAAAHIAGSTCKM